MWHFGSRSWTPCGLSPWRSWGWRRLGALRRTGGGSWIRGRSLIPSTERRRSPKRSGRAPPSSDPRWPRSLRTDRSAATETRTAGRGNPEDKPWRSARAEPDFYARANSHRQRATPRDNGRKRRRRKGGKRRFKNGAASRSIARGCSVCLFPPQVFHFRRCWTKQRATLRQTEERERENEREREREWERERILEICL